MKSIFVFLVVLMGHFASAQNPRVKPNHGAIFKDCDLGKNNEIWWNNVGSQSDTLKIFEFIKEKIFADTLYKKYESALKIVSNNSQAHYNVDKNGNLCEVKILFVLNYHRKKSVILDLQENPRYDFVLKFIDCSTTNLTLLPATKGGIALYGQRGSSGVVHLRIKDKLLSRKINKLLRNKKPNEY